MDNIIKDKKVCLFYKPTGEKQQLSETMKKLFKEIESKTEEFMKIDPDSITFPVAEKINVAKASTVGK